MSTPGDTDSDTELRDVQDDLTPLDVERCFAGSFIVDVRELSVDENLGRNARRNRNLNDKLVARLKEQFRAGVRRYAFADRIIVITSRASFMQIVDRLVGSTEVTMGADAVPESTPPDTQPGPTTTQPNRAITPAQQQILNQMRHRTQDKASTDWPMTLPNPVRVANGQHRIHALKSLVAEIGHGNSAEEYHWAVDCYVEDGMSALVKRYLETNKDPVRMKDSEGYLMFHIIAAFNECPSNHDRERLLKPEVMKTFLATQFQFEMPKIARLMVILRHAEWRNLVSRFCATKYGEEVFAWHTMSDIVTAKLDEIWIPIFSKFGAFATAVFPDDGASVTYNDWNRIHEVVTNHAGRTLRLLFFPTFADYESRKEHFPLPPGYHDDKDFPKLTTSVTGDDGLEYWNRRPDFLSRYSDDEYCTIYHQLLQGEPIECPKWSDLAKLERTVSSKMGKVLQHIVKWVLPSWKMPANASERYRSLVWSSFFADRIIRADDEPTRHRRALRLLKEIWEEIETNPVWQDRGTVEAQIRSMPPNTWSRVPATPDEANHPDDDAVVHYLERFQSEWWSRIVLKVVARAGPVLTGYMNRFNDREELTKQFQAFNPSGAIAANANWKENRVLQKIPALLNSQTKSVFQKSFEVAGALALYTELKRIMLNTLRHGMKYNAGQTSGPLQTTIIKTKEEYDIARETIQQFDLALRAFGHTPDLDNFNEDLGQLNMDATVDPAPAIPRKVGFIAAIPGDRPTEDEATRATRRSVASAALDRQTPSRGRKRTIAQVDGDVEPDQTVDNAVAPASPTPDGRRRLRLRVRARTPGNEND
ncbi:Hypothetical protein PENO1_110860 [Penicillium occitanis (nom. inval.)]|nr:Hypothetical protein PENO1_110860 [Penicillium occitanis (nom. inval.)]PCG88418.1 hypothetical protein PENOC_111100 [Penicillium occitanis (nom. inval.)]